MRNRTDSESIKLVNEQTTARGKLDEWRSRQGLIGHLVQDPVGGELPLRGALYRRRLFVIQPSVSPGGISLRSGSPWYVRVIPKGSNLG